MKRIVTLLLSSSIFLAYSQFTLAANPSVIIETSKGDITVELYADKAPASVDNFMTYVKSGHYSKTIFHRIIPGFMIQGGGFTESMSQKPTLTPIKNESDNKLQNERGTLAMARTSDPDSATSQFFINVRSNFNLDKSATNPGYAVFGKVTEGMSVVDDIVVQPTTSVGPFSDVPVDPILIKSVHQVKATDKTTAKLKPESKETLQAKIADKTAAKLKLESKENLQVKSTDKTTAKLKPESKETLQVKATDKTAAKLEHESKETLQVKATDKTAAKLERESKETLQVKATDKTAAKLERESKETLQVKATDKTAAKLELESKETQPVQH